MIMLLSQLPLCAAQKSRLSLLALEKLLAPRSSDKWRENELEPCSHQASEHCSPLQTSLNKRRVQVRLIPVNNQYFRFCSSLLLCSYRARMKKILDLTAPNVW